MKRYVDEPGTVRVRDVITRDAIVTSRLSEIEIASALTRRARDGGLTAREVDRALTNLRTDMDSIATVEVTGDLAHSAVALLARHALRAGDSVQVASCLYVRRHAPDVHFLAYDARLNDAARAEGIPLLSAR